MLQLYSPDCSVVQAVLSHFLEIVCSAVSVGLNCTNLREQWVSNSSILHWLGVPKKWFQQHAELSVPLLHGMGWHLSLTSLNPLPPVDDVNINQRYAFINGSGIGGSPEGSKTLLMLANQIVWRYVWGKRIWFVSKILMSTSWSVSSIYLDLWIFPSMVKIAGISVKSIQLYTDRRQSMVCLTSITELVIGTKGSRWSRLWDSPLIFPSKAIVT